ncbi:AmmeMemoRadiSam system protein A [Candidatus Margulisiibacteriota bacterium]
MASDLVELAKRTIEEYIKTGKAINPPPAMTEEMKGKAGVFVSLKKQGQLRGCIGTFAATTNNVAEEIIRNAIESATGDPRFSPVTGSELKDLEISVDVLTAPMPVGKIEELDARKYGVIVKEGMRRGLLLPNLDGVDTAEQQISICKRKAGIGENEAVELYKFEVRRYK